MKVQKLHVLKNKTQFNADLILFYFIWPIIIAPKEIQFIILAAILFDLLRRHKLYFDSLSYFIAVFITIYLISIVYNLIVNSYELDRIFATFNTFSIWFFSLLYYLVFKTSHLNIDTLKKVSFINYCILIVLWMFSLLIYIFPNLPFTLFNRNLYYTEWFSNREVIRFVGFMEYPNLITMFFMFFYPLYILYILNFKNKPIKIFFILVGILPILTTFSRSGYLVILTYLLVISAIYMYRAWNKKLFIAFVSISVASIIYILIYTNFSKDIFFVLQELLYARQGSNDSRTYLITESIRVTLESSPLIGMGIKITSSIGYPLGSHSTFVGFFYKTGIFGLITGSIIFLIIITKILFSKGSLDNTIIKFSLLLMIPLFVIEDIDGSNWLIIVYFIFIAVFINSKKLIEKEVQLRK